MIKLKTLTVNNWCQFEGSRTFKLDGDLIGIYGPNGCGKSNVIACIRYLLTGNSGNAGKQAADITEGKESGSATLKFDIDGSEAILKRELPSGACSLKFMGTELNKISEVKDRVLSLLKISHPSYLDTLLVKQGSMLEIIFSDPAERERRFHRLCGNAVIEAARAAVVSEKSMYPDQVVVEDDNEIEKEIVLIDSNLSAKRREFIECHQRCLSLEKKANLNTKLLSYELSKTLKSDLEVSKVKLDQAVIDLNELHKAKASLQLKSDEIGKRLDKLNVKDKEAQAILIRASTLRPILDKKLNLIDQVTELTSMHGYTYSDKLNDDVVNEIGSIVEDQNSKRIRIAWLKKIIDAFTDQNDENKAKNICPICESEVKDAWKRLTDAESETMSIGVEIGHLDKRKTQLWDQRDVLTKLFHLRRELEGLQGYQELDDDVINNAKQISAQRASVHQEFNTIESAIARLIMEEASFSAHIDNYTEGIKSLMKNIASNDPVSKEEAEQIRWDLDSNEELVKQAAVLSSNVNELEGRLQRENTRLEKIRNAKKLVKCLDSYKGFLNNVSDIMHRDKLQRLVVQHKRKQLNKGLNYFLNMFSLPFSAVIKNNMSISAVFDAGKVQPAERLSGGQKTALALSYIFAEAQLFCGDVGLLVLDEPTAFLDEDNISNMRELFIQVRSAIKNLGSQVLLVTHEKELKGVTDFVLDLSKDKE
jgi:DNA repair exonuclease SbcCD ATPase subunit